MLTDQQTTPLFDENQIEQLENILFSEQLNDEALDYFGLHGLVCSATIGPVKISDKDLLSLILGTDEEKIISDAQSNELLNFVTEIKSSIQNAINEGIDVYLPYLDENNQDQDSHFDACLESWCIGFMEGFFYQEKAWFTKGEEVTAELLLPIMALSGLFESEEFNKIRSNEKLTSQFEEIIPEQIVDIYLFYHSD